MPPNLIHDPSFVINPYDIDGFAAAIRTAIEMPEGKRARRMRAMRRVVAGHDVFVWASDILEGLERLGARPKGVRGADVAGMQRSPLTGAAAADRNVRR